MKGEFESMTEICKITPSLVPRPICWGSCNDSDHHFFICEFHDLDLNPVSVEDFAKLLAELHMKGTSSNNMFGFHVNTFNGQLEQDNTWTSSWETFFSNGIRDMLALEEAARGPSEELKVLSASLFRQVIPRLLRPLEMEDDLSPIRTLDNDWSRSCFEEYHKHMPKDEPVEDWEARNALYSLRNLIIDSTLYPTDETQRNT
ncbi:hypothetical protein N0V90_001585 [Kalmusia sp. IMI 367209]|nr:hypothetical protein N0V90_001585 [Kalmusia sp. IMI 367209]